MEHKSILILLYYKILKISDQYIEIGNHKNLSKIYHIIKLIEYSKLGIKENQIISSKVKLIIIKLLTKY